MNEPCGCYYGGDCTKTTLCALYSAVEELENRLAELEVVEAFCERAVNAYPDLRDEYEALGQK